MGLALCQLGLQCKLQRLAHGPVHIADLHIQVASIQAGGRSACGRIAPVHQAVFQLKLLQRDLPGVGRRLGFLGFFQLWGSGLIRCCGFCCRLSGCGCCLFFTSGAGFVSKSQPVDQTFAIAAGKDFRLTPAHGLQLGA